LELKIELKIFFQKSILLENFGVFIISPLIIFVNRFSKKNVS